MNLIDEIKNYDVDIDDALGRFMNNSALYEKMLKKFPSTMSKLEVIEYIKKGDYQTALENAHTIKGVAGNLSITVLYKSYSEAVSLMRSEKYDEAYSVITSIIDIQNNIIKCIGKYV